MKLLREMSCLVPAVLASQMLFAQACVTVDVKNESEAEITGFWGAQGCAKIYTHEAPVLTEICTHHKISPGNSKSYDYKWGATAMTLWMTFRVKTDYGTYNQMRRYIYEHGHFRQNGDAIPGTPPKCGTHYTIAFTQEDFLEEQNK